MGKYTIAWLPGDGVGIEVAQATKHVLDSTGFQASYINAEIGWACFEKYGTALPPETVEVLKSSTCAFLGAITSKPFVQGYVSPILKIRQMFELYAAVRPCKTFTSEIGKEPIDIVIFRENTEDLYKGIEISPIPEYLRRVPGLEDAAEDSALAIRLITKKGSERIIRSAFEYAVKKGRKKITCVHKANVLRKTDGLFLDMFRTYAERYPQIETAEENVDATAMWLVKNPADYDMIVTTNMFGDILSDEAAQIVGGLGLVPSANIGDDFALFEPAHGSAPKYAGLNKVNPIAAILAAAAMAEWLREYEIASAIEAGISEVLKLGSVRTYDLGGSHSTMQMAEAIAEMAKGILSSRA